MDMSQMRDIFSPHFNEINENVYLSNELAMVRGHRLMFNLLLQQTPPFVINDHRLGIITHGEGSVNFNLVDHHLQSGTIIYLGPGTIITPNQFSDDIELRGIGLFSDFPMPFSPGKFPAAFNGQVRDFQIAVSSEDIQTTLNLLDLLWHFVHQPNYHRPTVTALVAALMHHYDYLFHLHYYHLASVRSHEQTIFDRFIQLVNLHCREQHQIAYYADRMCLTERYLGTIIKQTSGETAKEWIDRALITHAKVLLRHSDKTVVEISEELCFPNPSFFSKYFKRLTNFTPLKFKNSKNK